MNYGHFDDAHCEYVITRPDTLSLDQLSGESFFSLMSNTSGDCPTFYRTRGFCA
ncbi:MAG: hypothetical protein ACLUE8_07300 [Lachnospiraceae bacterium]